MPRLFLKNKTGKKSRAKATVSVQAAISSNPADVQAALPQNPISPSAKTRSEQQFRSRQSERLVKDIARTVKKTVGRQSAASPVAIAGASAPRSRVLSLLAEKAEKPDDPFRPLREKAHPSRADLINAESALGSTLFGPVPAGHRREFFHDSGDIWIWHEAWVEPDLTPRELTIRYEVRADGVYKKVSAGAYYKLEGAELRNFHLATRAYLNLIKRTIYTKSN